MKKYGCLLVALGTPASPEPSDIRDFLRAFLSDPAVVDFPRWLWNPILHQIILRVRPEKIAPTYASIWQADGSPLEVYTKAQCVQLAKALPEVEVKFAMTYTKPSIAQTVQEFAAEGTDEIVLIPLCPHYVPSTVADIYRQTALLNAAGDLPKISIVPQWSTQKEYIAWYRQQLREAIAEHRPERIIFSYHGVPQRKAHAPNLYQQQCWATTTAIMAEMPECAYEVTFQSKFGPGKWLQPATIDRMTQLPNQGTRRILLLTPGFLADCIETLDELDVLNQNAFTQAGGEHFARVAPLNADAAAGNILAQILHRQIVDSEELQ